VRQSTRRAAGAKRFYTDAAVTATARRNFAITLDGKAGAPRPPRENPWRRRNRKIAEAIAAEMGRANRTSSIRWTHGR